MVTPGARKTTPLKSSRRRRCPKALSPHRSRVCADAFRFLRELAYAWQTA